MNETIKQARFIFSDSDRTINLIPGFAVITVGIAGRLRDLNELSQAKSKVKANTLLCYTLKHSLKIISRIVTKSSLTLVQFYKVFSQNVQSLVFPCYSSGTGVVKSAGRIKFSTASNKQSLQLCWRHSPKHSRCA